MTNINQTIDNGNIFEQPLKLAMFPDETGKIKVDPEERPYTLLIKKKHSSLQLGKLQYGNTSLRMPISSISKNL